MHAKSCLTLGPHGLLPARILCPWDFPGKTTGEGYHALLQGIFPTQGSNPLSPASPALAGGLFTTSTTWETLVDLCYCSSVPKVTAGSLWPYGLQHGGLPYLLKFSQTHVHCVADDIQPPHPLSSPSPSPAFNLFQHQGLFQCQPFTSGGQSIGASASASLLPMDIQGWFPLELTGLISLLYKSLSRVFSSTTIKKHLLCSAFFMVQFSHPYMTTGKTLALTIQIFVGKVMSLLFHKLSRFVPRVPLGPHFPHFPSCFSLPLELFSFFPQLSAAPGEVQFAFG